jgi:hypothetical protein
MEAVNGEKIVVQVASELGVIVAILRGKKADGLVEGSGLFSEPEAGQGFDAADGTSGYLSP